MCRSPGATCSSARSSASAALAGLSALGGLLLGGATANPLLATFTVFIGLLVWFNLVSRVMLLSGSWIAVGMFDSGLSPRIITPEQRAAEQMAAEHNARVIVARAELDDAKDELPVPDGGTGSSPSAK